MTSTQSSDRSFHQIVWPLAVGETIMFAGLLYSFAGLLLTWEQELPWGKAALSGAFSTAVLISAVCAPIAGRLIDRDWGNAVFTGSATFGAVMLMLLSQVQELWQFYLVWALIGFAMSGCLYEATFAIITRALAENARRAITIVTLVAGFASTLSFPLSQFLIVRVGWRGTAAAWGVIVLLIAVPLLWYGSRQASRNVTSATKEETTTATLRPKQILQNPLFWLLGTGYAMMALDHGMLINHIFPLLDEYQIEPSTAVFAASMIGPTQVAGRLGMLALEKRGTAAHIFMVSFVATSIAAITLLWSSRSNSPLILLALFVLLQGSGYGITSIIRPLLTAQFLGRANFGLISGMLAIPFLLALSGSTTIAAVIWEFSGGYDGVILMAILTSIIGFFAIWQADRYKQTHPHNLGEPPHG